MGWGVFMGAGGLHGGCGMGISMVALGLRGGCGLGVSMGLGVCMRDVDLRGAVGLHRGWGSPWGLGVSTVAIGLHKGWGSP